ncbi:uncharacterized protein LOC114255381 [Monomorium pharaonis]|uniref:uncharacterized protein LOC114255381 n=1 Tax=Monomorium pharaonis TaxID=307658 RepID=UPI00102E1D76|nr:uncharacterized protein LOC114255381 [Monomorium pharaonis]
MKGYVFVISLLMCGLAYSATQIGGYEEVGSCQWRGAIYDVGTHTIGQCTQLVCGYYGEVTVNQCPPILPCPAGYIVYSNWPNSEKPFPECCVKILCSERHNTSN